MRPNPRRPTEDGTLPDPVFLTSQTVAGLASSNAADSETTQDTAYSEPAREDVNAYEQASGASYDNSTRTSSWSFGCAYRGDDDEGEDGDIVQGDADATQNDGSNHDGYQEDDEEDDDAIQNDVSNHDGYQETPGIDDSGSPQEDADATQNDGSSKKRTRDAEAEDPNPRPSKIPRSDIKDGNR